jgi:hypothetical protein
MFLTFEQPVAESPLQVVALLGRFWWADIEEAEQLAKTSHPPSDRGMAGTKVSRRPQPLSQLPQPQQRR